MHKNDAITEKPVLKGNSITQKILTLCIQYKIPNYTKTWGHV